MNFSDRESSDVETWLREVCHTVEGPYLRPFAPNPRWREAKVFLVGCNPATQIARERMTFERYWHALTVDRRGFDEAYAREREEKLSITTQMSKIFLDALGLNCLIANISSYPAQDEDDIPYDQRSSAMGGKILTSLMKTCKPRAILFHGRPAVNYGSKIFGVNLDMNALPAQQSVLISPWYDSKQEVSLHSSVHLSGRGVSRLVMAGRMKEFARIIRNEVVEGDSATETLRPNAETSSQA